MDSLAPYQAWVPVRSPIRRRQPIWSDRLQPVIDDLTAGLGVTLQPTDDGLVIASTPDYAQTLSAGDGGIMDNPAVARALPDADGASAVAWVDLDVLGDLANLTSPEDGAVIAAA